MRKTFRYILAAAAALTLTGCANEVIEPDALRDCPTFSALIDGTPTRATEDYWERGDKIGISSGKYSNICYVTENGEGNFIVEDPDQKFYFQDNNTIKFIAYYPYYSSRNASTGLISISTADQTYHKDFDFLWAEAEGSRSSSDVTFAFKHKMSEVTFIFVNGQDMDVSTINKIRLNDIVVDGTFDTTTGECQASTTVSTGSATLGLTDVKAEMPVSPLFLFPQYVAGSVKLEIYDKNNQYFVCYLTIPDDELAAGNNYTYTITVNKTGLKVTEATISDWIMEYGEPSEASSADE